MPAETNRPTVRDATRADLEVIRAIVDETLFPGALLDEMIRPFFEDRDSEEFWLVSDDEGVTGVAYCVPEPMTEGTWNLRAIGVRPDRHRSGAGRALMAHVEDRLRRAGQRLLVVDTSSAPEQDGACAFYRGLGYLEESRISGFWSAGEDKITFTKQL